MKVGESSIDLSVIIVDFNSAELTITSVESILENSGDCQLEILIIDNSPCKTEQLLELSKKNQLIKYYHTSTNLGYGRANNIGINKSKGEFILIINPDIKIIYGKLDYLVNYAQKIKQLGALSCKLINSDGTFQESRSFNLGSVYSRLKSNIIFSKLIKNKKWLLPNNNKIGALMGSFLLFPKDVIIKTGDFDPDFFMYSEENELCMRIAKNNFELYYYEEMTVSHLNGGTITDNKWQFNQKILSDFLFQKKSFGLRGYLLHNLFFLTNIFSNYFFYYFLTTEMKQYTKSSFVAYFTQFKLIIKISFKSNNLNYCTIQPLKSKL
jgi:GT2 family glycosyltransferase